MPNIANKNRQLQPVTSVEQETLNSITNNKPLPTEFIPGIDVTNYIDPNDNVQPGNSNKTGIFGYFKQAIWDKLLGGVNPPSDAAEIRPRTIMGNSNLAKGARQVLNIVVDNGGEDYTNNTVVAFSGGGGTGATASALISNGRIVGVHITNGGEGYTSSPTIQFVDTIGSGAVATAQISFGGKISGKLLYAESNSVLSLLDPNGKYLGNEFYTKEEVVSILNQRTKAGGLILFTGLTTYVGFTPAGQGNEHIVYIANDEIVTHSFSVPISTPNRVVKFYITYPMFLGGAGEIQIILKRSTREDFAENVTAISSLRFLGNSGGNTSFLMLFVDDMAKVIESNGSPKTYFYRIFYKKLTNGMNNIYRGDCTVWWESEFGYNSNPTITV